MKKIIIALLIIIVLAVISYVLYPDVSKAADGLFQSYKLSSSTTTPDYLIGGTATSSQIRFVGGSDKVDVMLAFTASTSASVLQWEYSYSNDGIDWYSDDEVLSGPTLGSQVKEHASTTITHRWMPGSSVASTTRKVVTLPNIGANYIKILFSVPVGGSRGSIWTEWNIKTGQE